jgi:hypothetical protein
VKLFKGSWAVGFFPDRGAWKKPQVKMPRPVTGERTRQKIRPGVGESAHERQYQQQH